MSSLSWLEYFKQIKTNQNNFMKKNVLIPLCLFLICSFSNATVHVVLVSNIQFNPKVIENVFVGDTIRWQWVSGTHSTTCDSANGTIDSLPTGAAPWNSKISSDSTSFDYPVKVAGKYNYICIPHALFGMIGSFTASEALPVVLSSFQLSTTSSNASLTWKTASEENTAYFSVRRSSNGSEYTEIARLPAAGNSGTETLYSFTDNRISAKQEYYYYNLAIVDKDGRRMFSDTKLFKNKISAVKLITSLSPNPVEINGHLMLTFNADKEGKMDVKVINAEGRTVINSTMQAYSGVNNGHLHLGSLAAGNYSVVFQLNGMKETRQIIVR